MPESPRAAEDQEETVREFFTVSPVYHDGLLYIGSTERPGHRGHLRAIDLNDNFNAILWDAAEEMPPPGQDLTLRNDFLSEKSDRIDLQSDRRTLFTNLGKTLVPLTPDLAVRLQEPLGLSNAMAAEALIQTMRGRSGATLEDPKGTADHPHRLWGISLSSPAVVDDSRLVPTASVRERMLYVGAEDGFLHAFQAGKPEEASEDGAGRELWSYLPGSLLRDLREQPQIDEDRVETIHADGPPAVADLFVDLDKDGRRRWHTLLISTARSTPRQTSCIFALDISDPMRPQLLWEHALPGENIGLTRGGIIDQETSPTRLRASAFLTAAMSRPAFGNVFGIHACSLDPESGALRWQFTSPYPDDATGINSPPALPAMLDRNLDRRHDSLVFGDMAGRLWIIDTESGQALGDKPAYVVPGGAAEPIGAGVTVVADLILFGTGGAEHASPDRHYAIYALKFTADGTTLQWRYQLKQGEQVWSRPQVDSEGNIFFTTVSGNPFDFTRTRSQTAGRLIVLDASGETRETLDMGEGSLGGVLLTSGAAMTVSLTGSGLQLGQLQDEESPRPATLRIETWRER